ncbi:MAG: Sbal_3080 family lipoprotein [Pseudomonadota bacterium]
MRLIATSLLLAALGACGTSNTIVDAPTGDRITKVCIKVNTAVAQEGFLPEVVRQIEARGVETARYVDEVLEACPVRMSYTANWKWDLALFLSYAEFALTRDGQPVGRATYTATQWSSDKFGPTAEKIQPLIAQLFP